MIENQYTHQQVIKITESEIHFTGSYVLYSRHRTNTGEYPYLDFSHLEIKDFQGLFFDLSNDYFFDKFTGRGIKLKPVNGRAIEVMGYAINNEFSMGTVDLILTCDCPYKINKTYNLI